MDTAATATGIAGRVLYGIPGAWTDAWYDDPGAWWQWCCVFLGWSADEWRSFYARWRSGSDGVRERLSKQTGLWFFDWQRVPGGSIRGSDRAAADLIAQDLAQLPADADVTLVGHSKGGNALKHLLAVPREWRGAKPARAIFVDAPVDWLREVCSGLMGLGIARCALRIEGQRGTAGEVQLATVNNWLDPSGGRLRGVRNYQTFVWQDYLNPYPPHGMKGFLAERVLRDLGALPPPCYAHGREED
jgi:hypothetical protein